MKRWRLAIICCCMIISMTSCDVKTSSEIEDAPSGSGITSSSKAHTEAASEQASDAKTTDVILMTESEPVTQFVVNADRLSGLTWVDNETLSFFEIEKLPDESEHAQLAVYDLKGNKLSSLAIGTSPYDNKAPGAYIHDADDYIYYLMRSPPVSYVRIDRKTFQIEDCSAKLPTPKGIPYDGFYRAEYINGFYTASDETGLFLAPIDDLDAKQYIIKHDIANKTYYELYTQTESPYPNKSKAFIYKHEGYGAKFPNRVQGNRGDTTLQLLDFATNTTIDIAKVRDIITPRITVKLSISKYTDQFFVILRSDYPYDEFVKDFKGNEVYSTKKGHTLSIVGSTLYEYQKIDDYYVVSSLNLATMERTNLLYLKSPGGLLVSPTGDKLACYSYGQHDARYIMIYSLQT